MNILLRLPLGASLWEGVNLVHEAGGAVVESIAGTHSAVLCSASVDGGAYLHAHPSIQLNTPQLCSACFLGLLESTRWGVITSAYSDWNLSGSRKPAQDG